MVPRNSTDSTYFDAPDKKPRHDGRGSGGTAGMSGRWRRYML
jgi:hypothetical protein